MDGSSLQATGAGRSKPIFHYTPRTGTQRHLRIMVCERQIEHVTLGTEPHQLQLEWIPDMATSLVYACIGQDAIYLVDGLRHNILSELHTEALIHSMGISPQQELGVDDEQADLLVEKPPSAVLNDPQFIFLAQQDKGKEIKRWKTLAWSSRKHQLTLGGGHTTLVLSFDASADQLCSKVSPVDDYTSALSAPTQAS